MSSLDNDERLREKVDEAMAVYDEYVKNSGGDAEMEGEQKDGGASTEAEAPKA